MLLYKVTPDHWEDSAANLSLGSRLWDRDWGGKDCTDRSACRCIKSPDTAGFLACLVSAMPESNRKHVIGVRQANRKFT